jgi:protocadherin-16/23
MVKIQLTDINDNRPIFYPREYNVSLRESLPTSASVVVVVASDPDSGRFGTVTYRIVAGNDAGIFRIDRVTGEIFVTRPNLLSSRNQAFHRLNISAIDGGGLRTALDAEVFISIIDSSQRPPIFDKTRYNFAVKEDAKKNTIVGSVSATSSNSGELGCHLVKSDDNFFPEQAGLSVISDRFANEASWRGEKRFPWDRERKF